MKLLALVPLLLFSAYEMTAQVKRSYQDSKFTNTTIVVKEETADDHEILDAQFDIEEYGVGSVIKIKTEVEPETVATLETTTAPLSVDSDRTIAPVLIQEQVHSLEDRAMQINQPAAALASFQDADDWAEAEQVQEEEQLSENQNIVEEPAIYVEDTTAEVAVAQEPKATKTATTRTNRSVQKTKKGYYNSNRLKVKINMPKVRLSLRGVKCYSW